MFRIIKSSLILVLVITISTSCVVPKKQFDELLTEKVKMEADLNDMSGKIDKLETEIAEMEETLSTTTSERNILEKELKDKKITLSDLQAEHDKLQGYYDNAVNNSGRLNRDLAEQHNNLMALQETLDKAKQDNDQLADSLAIREQKVEELEEILAESQEAIRNLKAKISDALNTYNTDQLTVEEKNGKVYVSLSEKLLFRSGSTVVDPNGVKALEQLAQAIKNHEDIDIIVEGHTDNVPISKKSKYLQDNWDLSVLRATSILRILEKNGVKSEVISAAGQGEYHPVVPNTSVGNKQLNRRTEIILAPDITSLFDILGQEF